MRVYGGIDLHSSNGYLGLIDESDQWVCQRRLPNELPAYLESLAPYREQLVGVVVESTFNWYWLVDGLLDEGYRVHLVNPAAIVPYRGLKYSDDRIDSRWLGHLLRVGVVPESYIYPKEKRGLRDLMRKRITLVRQRTANVLSLLNVYQRSLGVRLTAKDQRELTEPMIEQAFSDANVVRSACAMLRLVRFLEGEIAELEASVRSQLQPDPALKILKSTPGIGEVLAPTILLETGSISRFASAGKYASYCRTVSSTRLSNDKPKGSGNRKNGNAYLAWAFVEAANFAIRYSPQIRRYYERKKAKTQRVVAVKTVAHKLARACYYMLRDQVPFEIDKAFG